MSCARTRKVYNVRQGSGGFEQQAFCVASVVTTPEEKVDFWVRNYDRSSRVFRWLFYFFGFWVLLYLVTAVLDGVSIGLSGIELHLFRNEIFIRRPAVGGEFLLRPGYYALLFLIYLLIPLTLIKKFIFYTFAPYDVVAKAGELRSEQRVAEILDADLPDDFYIFNSLEVGPKRKKGEMDHLVVGESGVHIITTLQAEGSIRPIDQRSWREEGQENDTHEFYNPLKQNESLIAKLKKGLSEPLPWIAGIEFGSVVVFCGNVDLEPVHSQGYRRVLVPGKLGDHILRDTEADPLTLEQKEEIVDQLQKMV